MEYHYSLFEWLGPIFMGVSPTLFAPFNHLFFPTSLCFSHFFDFSLVFASLFFVCVCNSLKYTYLNKFCIVLFHTCTSRRRRRFFVVAVRYIEIPIRKPYTQRIQQPHNREQILISFNTFGLLMCLNPYIVCCSLQIRHTQTAI